MEMGCEGDGSLPWPWRAVRRRRHMDDSFFQQGDELCNVSRKQIPLDTPEIEPQIKSISQFRCDVSQCQKEFNTVAGYEVHYNSVHRNVCSHCHRSLPTNHLLEIHLLEWHDAMFDILAAKTNMFQCLVKNCEEKFPSTKARKNHLIKVHKYPANFRFDRSRKGQGKIKTSNNQKKVNEIMETESGCQESSNSERLVVTSVGGTPEASHVSESGRRFVYRVPKTICFGQGASRGFQRSPAASGKKKNKKKHWHQKGTEHMDTEVNIEEVNMKDLAGALENS